MRGNSDRRWSWLEEYASRTGSYHGRPVVMYRRPMPLVGHIAFGVIDRGTNIVQVRPTTLCPHACIFCSVDAGPISRTRATEIMVEPGWLAYWASKVASIKGGAEALLDGVGEPLSHPGITSLISMLSGSGRFDSIALETHGGFLSKRLILELERAGLNRINLSVDAVSPGLARRLVGVDWYDVERILRVAEWAIRETSIDVVLTPVVVPGYNEAEIRSLIEWARRVGAGRKSEWPTGVLVQKFERHKWGRSPQGVKEWGWGRFYEWLRRLERESGYRLLVEPWEVGIRRAPQLEKPYRRGDRVRVVIVGPGWHKGEYIGVDRGLTRIIAVTGLEDASPGQAVTVRISRDKDNIYLARA